MALAGAPFGLRSNEAEGLDYGRCVAILVGGPAGGHAAAVLGAVRVFVTSLALKADPFGQAFHPAFPIIATCGVRFLVHLHACLFD